MLLVSDMRTSGALEFQRMTRLLAQKNFSFIFSKIIPHDELGKLEKWMV